MADKQPSSDSIKKTESTEGAPPKKPSSGILKKPSSSIEIPTANGPPTAEPAAADTQLSSGSLKKPGTSESGGEKKLSSGSLKKVGSNEGTEEKKTLSSGSMKKIGSSETTEEKKPSSASLKKGSGTSQETPGSPKRGSAQSVKSSASPTPSKIGSAKSLRGMTSDESSKKRKEGATMSPEPRRSSASAKSEKSDLRRDSTSGHQKKKGKKSRSGASSPHAGDSSTGLPDGVVPLFLASKTQELFGLRADADVTAENPTKMISKEEVLRDLFNRAAICDFHPIKQLMVDYPGEDILIVYDPDFKHGQNFYVATTEEAKHALLKSSSQETIESAEDEEPEEICIPYTPPVAKPWQTYGSEVDIEEETIVEHRKKIIMSIRRMRREFGAPIAFEDRNADKLKGSIIDCPPYDDKAFDLKRMELDKGTQAVPVCVDTSMQTNWKYPKNAAIQYVPREFNDEEKVTIEASEEYAEFIKLVAPRLELALQQNEIADVFYDDWASLITDDGSFGSKADNHLKEFQSFTDLQFSKERTITCIDWHPTIKGVVAVSVGERLSFDDRIDNAGRIIMTPSLILIWSFTDPIHPQLLLEAPEDILCFKFSPTDPNIVAGGCINGQVVLWDISQHSDRLKQVRAVGGNKGKDNFNLPGFEDDNALHTPIVRYAAVSSIEHSHCMPVTDILWIPDHFEINRMGIPQENKSGQCCQLLTCATDHSVNLWDIRAPKTVAKQPSEEKNLSGIPTTFKHLDLIWKPHMKITLSRNEPGGDQAPTKFSISEVQGDKSALLDDDDTTTISKTSDTAVSEHSAPPQPKPASSAPGSKRTLKKIKTMLYVGTEDGELVYVDWMPAKDQESGRIQTPKPEFTHTVHCGPIVTLQRSPFFRDVVLCVGGWNFSIWKEGVSSSPILRSAASTKRLTAGHWSPSRPSVFFITKQDGSIDIWDLLDRTHEPCMNQSVSPAPITYIFPYQVTSKQHLLAVGDAMGTLHILSIPWSLRQPTPNELNGMSNYFEREVKRRAFVVERWNFREQEKMELEADAKRKAGIAPQVVLSDEEIENRMRIEYQAYLEEESTFLRHLGLLKEETQPSGPVEPVAIPVA